MFMWLSMFHLQAIKVVQYNINTEELYVILKEFIHMLYFRWEPPAFYKNSVCEWKSVNVLWADIIVLNQAPAGEPSRQKSGHHRVHPLPVPLQRDTHQSFLQTVWGTTRKRISVLWKQQIMFGVWVTVETYLWIYKWFLTQCRSLVLTVIHFYLKLNKLLLHIRILIILRYWGKFDDILSYIFADYNPFTSKFVPHFSPSFFIMT